MIEPTFPYPDFDQLGRKKLSVRQQFINSTRTKDMYKNTFNRAAPVMGRLKKLLLIINSAICRINEAQRRKWIMRINITTILMVIALAQLSAKGFGQKITLNTNQMPVEKILQSIRDQSGYRIFYDSKDLNDQKITIKVKDAPVEDAIKTLTYRLEMDYKIVKNTIVLTKKDPSVLDKLIARFQAIDIRGKILDEKGEPLAGATVAIKGSGRSVKTNEKGAFYLQNVGVKDKLVISYLGYQTREVDAAADMGSLTLNVAEKGLEEVIVNKGYYTENQRLSTGSVGKITGEVINQQPVTNVLGALIGRVPGLEITQTGGIPGAGFKVRIRGQNSIAAGNEPLYIIDGVPFSSASLGDQTVSPMFPVISETVSPLNSLSPSDISSVEVLKDADATAIYGSRGANGVILITTRKGQAGKTRYNLNLNSGFSQVGHMPKMLKTPEYLQMRREALANDGIAEPGAADFDLNGTWDQDRYTDWQKELIGGKAETFNLQGSVSGGSERTQFFVKGGFQKETTVFPGDFHYQRGSALFNLNHRSQDDKFHLTLSTNYGTDDNNLMSTDLARAALWIAPNAPKLRNEDGSLNWADGTWNNPLSYTEGKYNGKSLNMTSNLVINYQLLPNLQLKSSLGYSDYRLDEFMISPSTMYDPALGQGSESSAAYANNADRQSWIIEPQINWQKKISAGLLQVLAGTTFQHQSSKKTGLSAFGFPSDNLLYDMSAATTREIGTNATTEYRYQAFFGRINYNWKDKYLLNLTARRDGSSRFGPGNQFSNFGAVGGAWIISEEDFIKEKLPFINYSKLRSSYGVTGNDQIGDYQFLNTYSTDGSNYQNVKSLNPQRLYNRDFGWEINRKLELALELGLFSNVITTSLSWYRNRSSNQLVGIPLSGITGFNSIQANLGAKVQNTGWELELQSKNFDGKKFKWTTAVNLTIPKNKLLAFPGLEGSTYANTYVVGKPLSIVKRFHFTGIDPEKGIYQYQDINGDGIISSPNDAVVIRNLAPHFYGGLNNSLTLGNWQLDIFFQFISKTANTYRYSMGMPGMIGNMPVEVLNRWQAVNVNTKFQRFTTGRDNAVNVAYSKFYNSDAAIEDTYFIRLKNIELAYVLPEPWIKGARCRFLIQAQNLWTLTDYKVADPEIATLQDLPPLRSINLGLQFTF
jgi:TonB-linked SusC/RagA family outer membrane protein